jgi:hypothetical protein
MADQETIAAILTGALLQERATRLVGQAQLLSAISAAAASSAPGRLGGNPNEVADAVSLYFDVLKELADQIAGRVGSP